MNAAIDCTMGWLGGVIRGLGIMKIALYGMLGFFYLFCLPL